MKLKILFLFFVFSFSQLFAKDLPSISPIETQELINKKEAILIDVREKEETDAGIASGALILPLSHMTENKNDFDKKVSELPKDKTIIVYCRSGRRSSIVGDDLQKKGFKVLNMRAFDSWKKAGFKTENK